MMPRQCRSKLQGSRCTLNVKHKTVHFADEVKTESYAFWLRRGQRPVIVDDSLPNGFTRGWGRTSQAHVWILRLVIAARLARQSRYNARHRTNKHVQHKETP